MNNAATKTTRDGISYGSKYDSKRDVTEIAKLVRADIKAAVKEGVLPVAKYSVRVERFSGGRAIDVTVSGLPFESVNEAYVLAEHDEPKVFCNLNRNSAGAVSAEHVIRRILGAYNFDGSDSSTDHFHVNFYSNVRFDADRAEERAAILARNGRTTVGAR